jgi:hypothetical protein
MLLKGKIEVLGGGGGKEYRSANSSTTNLTRTGPGIELGAAHCEVGD